MNTKEEFGKRAAAEFPLEKLPVTADLTSVFEMPKFRSALSVAKAPLAHVIQYFLIGNITCVQSTTASFKMNAPSYTTNVVFTYIITL